MSAPSDDDRDIERLLRHAGPRPAVPDDVARRVRAATHAAWRGGRERRTPRWSLGWGLAAAAAVILALATIGVARRWTAPPGVVARVESAVGAVDVQVGYDVARGTVLRTPEAGRLALRTGAGHSVRLDGGSTLTLRSGTVFALERGAVYVDARASGDDPLAIDTPFGEVRHVGTQYEVRLLDRSLRLQVREGRAEVRHGARTLPVDAGSELTLDADGATRQAALPPYGPRWDWVQQVAPAPEIDGRPLHELLEWVERECGQEIAFEDPALAARSSNIVLSGSIRGLSPLAALEAVLPTCGLTFQAEPATIRIVREDLAAD
jgi:ferric-dicitrate binding protein FerR (iron transport regulator)